MIERSCSLIINIAAVPILQGGISGAGYRASEGGAAAFLGRGSIAATYG